jgi:hypothetical protein
LKDEKVKYDLSRDGYQWERGGQMARVKKDDYGGCTLYTYMKIEQ